ncbi:hypothetical protein [Bacillus solitudinis]|uniref:hypothetical protein n=1 Tax=Bacillus solitudinis TaxID=2014074 RepID=UPI000C237BBC|nr:hypothetical protein [Bacillus solitudinis]
MLISSACKIHLIPIVIDFFLLKSINNSDDIVEEFDEVHIASGTLSCNYPLISLELFATNTLSKGDAKEISDVFIQAVSGYLESKDFDTVWEQFDFELYIR